MQAESPDLPLPIEGCEEATGSAAQLEPGGDLVAVSAGKASELCSARAAGCGERTASESVIADAAGRG